MKVIALDGRFGHLIRPAVCLYVPGPRPTAVLAVQDAGDRYIEVDHRSLTDDRVIVCGASHRAQVALEASGYTCPFRR